MAPASPQVFPEYSDTPTMGFLAWVKKKNGPTLAEAIRLCIEAKLAANRRIRYVKGLRQYLNLFARGRETVSLSSVANVSTVDQWFSERNEKPITRASNIGRLSALFAFAHRRGWINENPCFRLERVTIEKAPPKILAVEQAKRLLQWCRSEKPAALAFLVLCLLGGLRPEETYSVGWENIDLQGGFVTVSAASKIRSRRIVKLEPNAVRWLKLAKRLKARLPISRSTHRRYIRAFRAVLGFTCWPQDLFRHTCASYWLALKQDAAYVSHQLGNSPETLHRHYKELVSKAEVKAFWKLSP